MISIKDIARKLNISPSTVSRAINSKSGVGKVLKAKIQKIAKEEGYHPNYKARALVGGNVGVIGVIIPRSAEFTFSNPFYPQILKGIGKVAAKFDSNLLLSFEGTESYASLYLKRLVDGIIILGHRLDDNKINELKDRNIPTVLIPGYLDEGKSSLPSIDAENVQSVYDATNHLLKLGHRKIGFILGAYNSKYTLERLAGYKKAFQRENIPIIKSYIIESDFTKSEGFRLMKKLLALPQPPTAFIGINDNVTIGGIQAIYHEKLRVPKDISVITIGDSEYVSDFTPPLTAIRIPMVEIGRKAAQTLFNVLKGVRLKKKSIILPSQFIVRGSTDISSG